VLSIEKDTGLNKVFFTAMDTQGTMILGDIDIAVDIPNDLTTDTMIKCRPSVIHDFRNNYVYIDDIGEVDFSEKRVQLEFAYGISYIEVIDDNKAFPTLSKFSTKISNLEGDNYYVMDDVQVMKDSVTTDAGDIRIPKEWGKVPITITFIGDETGVIPLIEEGDRKIFYTVTGDDGEIVPVRKEEKKYTNILNKLSKGDRIRICGVEARSSSHLVPGLIRASVMSLYITKYSSIVKI
jgi:hypothetical protein